MADSSIRLCYTAAHYTLDRELCELQVAIRTKRPDMVLARTSTYPPSASSSGGSGAHGMSLLSLRLRA